MDANGFTPKPLPASLRLAAAERLVEGTGQAARQAARRIIDAGAETGVAFDHAMATYDAGPQRVRELALAIPSPGRSALVFLSRPKNGQDYPQERAACALALTDHLAALPGNPLDIAQSLPATSEPWAIQALMAAGWQRVGDLAYMRRPLRPDDAAKGGLLRHRHADAELPPGVDLEPVRVPQADHPAPVGLVQALEDSYLDTLDCPALCGMRRTSDIIASHAAIGRSELALWSLIRREGRPAGALLFACLPEQRCYELVYLGLGPSLRGLGLGEVLLRRGIGIIATRIRQSQARNGWSLTCAVDIANLPAVRLYQRLDFVSFDRRVACVHPLRQASSTVVAGG